MIKDIEIMNILSISISSLLLLPLSIFITSVAVAEMIILM